MRPYLGLLLQQGTLTLMGGMALAFSMEECIIRMSLSRFVCSLCHPLLVSRGFDARLCHAAETPGLLIGPQNSLLCFDPRSRLQRWSTAFDAPLVAAFPGGSAVNMLPGESR